ncbi:MAG: 3-hydroxyacyl-ACP dehydratase FabZ [Candidatus Bipolaricaulaceae bacterium]
MEALKRRLPVGYPFLLIDRVVEQGPEKVVTQKCVSIGEPFFQGHFRPPWPSIMPGTLILEGMAQTAGLLLGEEGLGVLAAVERARFHRPVVPGDRLVYRARLRRRRGDLVQVQVEAEREGERVAEAVVTLMRWEDVGTDR